MIPEGYTRLITGTWTSIWLISFIRTISNYFRTSEIVQSNLNSVVKFSSIIIKSSECISVCSLHPPLVNQTAENEVNVFIMIITIAHLCSSQPRNPDREYQIHRTQIFRYLSPLRLRLRMQTAKAAYRNKTKSKNWKANMCLINAKLRPFGKWPPGEMLITPLIFINHFLDKTIALETHKVARKTFYDILSDENYTCICKMH